MTKPNYLIPLTIGLLASSPTWAKSTTTVTNKNDKRPNIILFLVDDMGWQDSSLPFLRDENGNAQPTFLNKRYHTPNMEKLAAKGMMFTNAYAQAVCSPSRTSLMTGMNSARHRVTNWTLNCDTATDAPLPHLNSPTDWNMNGLQPNGTLAQGKTLAPISGKEINYKMTKPFLTGTTLPELLKKSGYTTIHCGKAHWGTRNTPGANPLNLGFTYNIAGTEVGGPGDYRGSKHYGEGQRFGIKGLDENNYYQDDVFLTEALTIEALKRLDKIQQNPQEKNQPFYLYMSHYAIHSPFDQRGYDKRFADKYTNPHDGEKWSDNEKRYAGLIEGMDKSLGDIMAYLDKNNLADNTIILFMADNGGLAISGRMGNQKSNYPLSFGKGSCREGGIREPMIVYWPKVTAANSICSTPVIIEDFFPSILDMAQVKDQKTTQIVDGKTFIPLLKGEKIKEDHPLLFHCPNIWGEGNRNHAKYHPYTAVRQGDWKLIYWHGEQSFELFNITQDISEKNNLAKVEPERTKNMVETMTKLLIERKAQMPTFKEKNPFNKPAGTPVPLPNLVVQQFLEK